MRAFVLVFVAACGRFDFDPLATSDGAMTDRSDGTASTCTAAHALQPQSTTPVGNQPLTLSVGDVNGDHHADIAVVNEGDATVSILLGDGTGTFTHASTLMVGTDPKFSVLADFNHDGTIDLVVANGGLNEVYLYPGDGTGTFNAHSTLATDGGPRWLAFGELTTSGFSDLLVECNGSADVDVLFGKSPPGTYGMSQPETVGAGPHGMVVADLDHDGNLDIVTADSNDETVSILYGLGGGTFAPRITLVAGNYPGSVSIGDLNRDGLEDVVVPNTTDGTISVFLGMGTRTFMPQSVFPAPGGPNTADVGDITGDGIPDVVTSNGGDSGSTGTATIGLLQGNGDGTFQAPVMLATGTKPWGVVIADINGDGKQDVAIVNEGLATDLGPGTLGVFVNGCM